MKKILFVCLGNICRSPMAEFVMKDLAKKAGRTDFEIASVAVSSDEVGNPLYPPARQELTKHGIACSGHVARQITEKDLAYFDHIYYMDASNARYLNRLFGEKAAKCCPLLDHDVADPWYTGNFEITYRDVVAGCSRILEELT